MNAETIYDQYWTSGLHDPGAAWSEKKFRQVLGPLMDRERVLDYGCGFGIYYQKLLASAVANYAGADVAPIAVSDLRRKGFEAYKIDPATGAMDCPAETFDGATCIEVFEHLYDPLQSARELYRVLKPGAVLIATVPNFGYHAWRLMALLRAQVPSEPENFRLNRFNGVHLRFFSKLNFKRLLRDAGFSNVSIGSFGEASIWDVTRCAGPFAAISDFARARLPAPFHARFLQDLWPNVFAERLRAVSQKPNNP